MHPLHLALQLQIHLHTAMQAMTHQGLRTLKRLLAGEQAGAVASRQLEHVLAVVMQLLLLGTQLQPLVPCEAAWSFLLLMS